MVWGFILMPNLFAVFIGCLYLCAATWEFVGSSPKLGSIYIAYAISAFLLATSTKI